MTNDDNEDDSKIAIIVAGGNGSGKTKLISEQIIPRFESFNLNINFINADIWQKEHFGEFTNDPSHALQAAQWAEEERQRNLDQGISFIAETVFSHPSKIELIKEAKDKGFFVALNHIHLDTPEIALSRIEQRVELGGHGVSEEKVRQRYQRVIPLIAEASQYADETIVFDNSVMNQPHSAVMKLEYGKISEIYRALPRWVVECYAKQLAETTLSYESSLTEIQSATKANDIKEKLGFNYDSSIFPDLQDIPTYPKGHVVHQYQSNLPNHIENAAVLSNNPIGIEGIKEIMSGYSIPNQKLSDLHQIQDLLAGSKHLIKMFENDGFKFNKETYLELNKKVAAHDSFEPGVFRGEGQETAFTPYVGIRHHISHKPIATEEDAPKLNKIWEDGIEALKSIENPMERGIATYLFCAKNQFTFEGEKRTALLMMNGELMNSGLQAMSLPKENTFAFQDKMLNFYKTNDASSIMEFMVNCYPEITNIRQNAVKNERNQDFEITRSI
ncbi:zeta toxin family protein [Acinetobacter sp. Marseille-Q1618]|uniref:zeta toxin family protein n=1 Tax=Acinetobacter sp. Marseille-Q1618 TaxID=2697502 RepID=UPI00156E9DCB|nr:zeta toxin family protein [Acinetobacter sp. Marseille-Q1618]